MSEHWDGSSIGGGDGGRSNTSNAVVAGAVLPSDYGGNIGSSTAPSASEAEDCRDYLRTGRCKYGASCKYRHPPNVQSGGGMKGPTNPTEPLHPIRPNEPVCQYFMKHGTCKFGQACKFNHPPNLAGIGGGQQNILHHNGHGQNNQSQHYQNHHQHNPNVQTQHQIVTLANGNTVLVSVPISSGSTSIGSFSGDRDHNGTSVSGGVQILPQRPSEPNCIFFLKNGRCKYGATCRYHHPLNYHTDRNIGGRIGGNSGGTRGGIYQHHHQHQQQVSAPQVHYLAQLPPGSTMKQGHFVVADGNVTFLALDGNSPAHFVSVAAQQPGNGSGTTIASSTASNSSIASSFETAISSTADGQDSSSSHWTTPTTNARRLNLNGGNSFVDLTTATTAGRSNSDQAAVGGPHNGQSNRTVYVQNAGDASSLGGLPRVVSASSTIASDPVFYEAGPSPSAWRGSRSASFDHTRSRPTTGVQEGDDDGLHKSISVHSALDEHSAHNMRGRHPPGIRSPRRQSGQVDEGLSMMTSALLTMLDTPAADTFDENFEYGTDDQEHALTPRMGTHFPSATSASSPREHSSNVLSYHPQQPHQFQPIHRQSQQDQRGEYPNYGGDQAVAGAEGSTVGNISTHNSLESFQSFRGESITQDSSNGWIIDGTANENESSDSHQLSSSHNVGLYLP